MTNRTTMDASMRALMTMLEGETDWEGRTARILYSAFTGMDGQLVRVSCETMIDHGYDGVLALFDPADAEPGPARIGVTFLEGDRIKLQMGRLWMAPRADRAVLVPHGVGKRHGHHLVKEGRIVQLAGWPADSLDRGTRRAEARLAELTTEYAHAGALAL